MIIRTLITFLLSIYAGYLTMRHNMHMFQLNGYKVNEQLTWIKRNLRQQWLLLFGLCLGVIRCFFPFIGIDIVVYITLLLDIVVYRVFRRINTKKKLVYTPRVKRIISTIIILSLVVLFGAYKFLGFNSLSGICLIIVSGQLGINIFANILNQPIEKGINQYYINDAKRILKESNNLKIIGITGSYGKTSVKYYLQTLLENTYDVLVTPGNYNTTLGVTRTIREQLRPNHEIFICEMGARYVGDIKEICDLVHPDYGIITSIGPQHLDTFLNIDNIQKTKFELADSIPENGIIFLNGDNEYILDMASHYSSVVKYSCENRDGDYRVSEVKVSNKGTSFKVIAPHNEVETFNMKLIGAHNIINVVGAIAVANTLGIKLKDLIIPVRRLLPVEHRMQIRDHGEVTIIDDAYNSNPIGSKAAVNTLALFDGVKILITPGMVELGEKEADFNYAFGRYAADCCDYILLVGKDHIIPIKEGVLSKNFPSDKCVTFANLQEALSYAYAIKENGHKYILLENDLPDNY